MYRNFLNNYFIKVLKIRLRPLAIEVFFYSNYSQIKTAILFYKCNGKRIIKYFIIGCSKVT